MERWRSYFGSSGEDLWTVIDSAITIAAIDYPQELRVRRDGFAEKLFAPAPHYSASSITEGPPLDGRVDDLLGSNYLCPLTSSIGERPALTRSDCDTGASPESLTQHILEEQHKTPKIDLQGCNVSADDKFLLEKTLAAQSEESVRVHEILLLKERIKNLDQNEETEETCLLVLSQLEKMKICVPALKATGIGKPVNGLRKHPSRRVRSAVKILVSLWKDVVDEWVKKEGDDFAAAFVDSGASKIDQPDNAMSPPCRITKASRASKIDQPDDTTSTPCRVTNTSPSPGRENAKKSEIRVADNYCEQMKSRDLRHYAREPNAASATEERHPRPTLDMHDGYMNNLIVNSGSKGFESDSFVDLLQSRENDSGPEDLFISTNERFERLGGGLNPATDPIRNGCNKLNYLHHSCMAHKSSGQNGSSQKQKHVNSAVETDMTTKDMECVHQREAAKPRLSYHYQQTENAKKQRTAQVMDIPSSKLKHTGHATRGPNARRAFPVNIYS